MNGDTEKLALWITNDGDFVRTAHDYAKTDPDGTGAFRTYLTRLLRDYIDDGRPVTSRDQRHSLAIVNDDVALGHVDWTAVRNEVADMDL